MKKQKNKFLTFLLSLIPGAGHMYMGFMHMGLSIMGAFWLIIAISTITSMGQLLFLLPLLWFYSFFDSMNKASSAPEEFAALEDRWFFVSGKDANLPYYLQKYKGIAGIILVLFGLYMLVNNFSYSFYSYLPNFVRQFIHLIPQLVVAILIIALGVRLILGKRKEMQKND